MQDPFLTQDHIEPEENNSPEWLSISDLMAALMLLFVLLFSYFALQHQSQQAALIQNSSAYELLREEVRQSEQRRRIIIGQLVSELRSNNVDVDVNPETGDVSLREGVFFDEGSAVLKPDGLALLRRFVPVYSRVIFTNTDVANEVTRILIEGHTSSTGAFDYNLELSLRRANSVANAIFSNNLAEQFVNELSEKLLIAGRGEIESTQNQDIPGERRVIFRFLFRGDKFIANMLSE